MQKYRIYLDDVRKPVEGGPWVVVRSYDEFVQKINEIGLENIELISLDHDLGDSAMKEWLYGVVKNYEINYDNIDKIRGMDICINTSASNKEDAKALLEVLNFPFKK